MIKAWITDYLGALLRFTYYKYVKSAYSGGYPFSISGDIRSVPS